MVGHPEQKSDVEEAVKLFKNLKLEEKDVTFNEIEVEKNKLLASLNFTNKPARLFKMSRYRWIASIAASIILILGSLYLFELFYGNTVEKTTYGEIAEKQLPDGTSVLLNSNSSVSYSHNWSKSKAREVWVKGEAFFHVTKKPDHQRFIVHTDQFDVIVTGTKFNVLNRENKATVMLKEGGVTIHFLNGKEIRLKPGESIDYASETKNIDDIKPEIAKEEKVLAWVNRKLYFENTNMLDVCQKIRELYGLDIEFGADSTKVAGKTITGILPNDNLDVLLESIEATSEFKFQHKDNKLIITLP